MLSFFFLNKLVIIKVIIDPRRKPIPPYINALLDFSYFNGSFTSSTSLEILNLYSSILAFGFCKRKVSKLEFKNVNAEDKTIYKTFNEYDDASKTHKTYIAAIDDKKEVPIKLNKTTAPNGVLKLYCLTQAATANSDRIKELEKKYTTPVPNAAAEAYANKKEEETGKQLSIVSK